MVDAPYAIRKMIFIAGSPPLYGVFSVLSMIDAPYAIRKMLFIAGSPPLHGVFQRFVNDRRAICYLQKNIYCETAAAECGVLCFANGKRAKWYSGNESFNCGGTGDVLQFYQ